VKLLLSFLLLAVAVQGQHKIESTYDRFTDKTTVRVYYMQVGENPQRAINLDAFYSYDGQVLRSPPKTITLRFVSGGAVSFGSDSPRLYVLGDEQRAIFDPDIRSDNGTAIYHIPFDQIETFLKAKQLEMRVGTVEITLTDDTLKALREFIPPH